MINVLDANSDNLIINLLVIKRLLSFLTLSLSLELSVPIVQRLISFLIDYDDGFHYGEAFRLNQFVEVEVVEFGGKVSDVEGGETFLFVSCLFSTVALG